MPKIQVVVDETVNRILTQMSMTHLRGSTISQVASTIIDEWIWHNNGQLKDRGINLRAKKVNRKRRRK
jgi:hypothetical protein